MDTKLDRLKARILPLMLGLTWNTQPMPMVAMPKADADLLLAVAEAAAEWKEAEDAWAEADALYTPGDKSDECWKEIHAKYEQATKRSRLATDVLFATIAPLMEKAC